MNPAITSVSQPLGNAVVLSSIEKSVVRSLLYFEIFNHPLRVDEIIQCLDIPVSEPECVKIQIEQMVENGYIRQQEGYYFINCKPDVIKRRIHGEELAIESLKKAKLFSSIIARFPFVRAVSLSGSISKYYMDKNSDIDYFIITRPGRMWVARTFLVLFKKLVLLNSKKYFCVNYFITEESLELKSRNVYSATELTSIIPTYNYGLYRFLMTRNSWVNEYYPNFPVRCEKWLIKDRKYFLKKTFEKLLSGKLGEQLDIQFYRMTLRHWKKKFSHFDESTFDHRLRNGRNESKHHPLGYQQRVLQQLSEKIGNYEHRFELSLRK